MIRSVGVGGSSVSNQPPRRPQQALQTPFPDISGLGDAKSSASAKAQQPIMVGVKPAPHVQSIFDEENGVIRLNADGDRLEVSKKAISLAKEKLFV